MRDGECVLSGRLLDWYDENARDLPWRMPPARSRGGELPDPYRVWLSEIMLQQTTVAAVGGYFRKFTENWPSVQALANAADDTVMAAWAGLGYYARARNLLKCARLIASEYDGRFPQTTAELQALPGIGPYTAGAIAAIAFGRSEVVVDGNVERVMARLFALKTPLPQAKPALVAHAKSLTPRLRAGDYAQAVMDLGATICTARNPTCGLCPLRDDCLALKQGIAADLPARTPKKAKPVRKGIAYIATRSDGAVLLERRPNKGLLGGMLGWPGGDWGDVATVAPPFEANWRVLPGEVRHTFTHFHLLLEIHVTDAPLNTTPMQGEFINKSAFQPSDLPTVMRKAYDLASRPNLKV